MFNPGQVSLGSPMRSGSPYLPTAPVKNPMQPRKTDGGQAPMGMGAQAVRATAGGPFDAAYRQNLATYAGGNLARPGGMLQFDPTSRSPFGDTPPTTLLEQALGGGGVSFSSQQPQQARPAAQRPSFNLGDWLKQFSGYSNLRRPLGSVA